MTEESLSIIIQNPQEIVWQGKARSLSSVNTAGPFDVLPQHANFVTYIQDQPIHLVDLNGEEIEFNFPRAVLYTRDNLASVFTF